MGLSVLLYPFLLSSVALVGTIQNGDDIGMNDFIEVVLNGYDVTRSFAENFYDLLYAICPESVYCAHTSGVDGRKLSDSKNDNSTFQFSDNLTSKYQPDLVIEARNFLRNNSHRLNGCCRPCSCDTDCREKQICCPFPTEDQTASNGSIKERQITQECVAANIKSYLPNHTYIASETIGISYYMVTDCFLETAEESVKSKCRKPNQDSPAETTPVFSETTRRNYKNRFCAECNNDGNVSAWKHLVTFVSTFSLTGLFSVPTTAQEIYSQAVYHDKYSTMYYEPPSSVFSNIDNFACSVVTFDASVDDLCYADNALSKDQITFLAKACAYQNISFESKLYKYDNVFCYMCRTRNALLSSERKNCNFGSRAFRGSFSAVLRTETSQPVIDSMQNNGCKCTEYFDSRKNVCRQLFCPPGECFVQCSCVAFLTDITGMRLNVFLELNPVVSGLSALKQVTKDIDETSARRIVYSVMAALRSNFGQMELMDSVLYREKSAKLKHHVKFYNMITIMFKSMVDNRKLAKTMFTKLLRGLTKRILNVPMIISLGPVLKISSESLTGSHILSFDEPIDSDAVRERLLVTGDLPPINSKGYQTLSKLIFCTRIKLQPEEVESMNNKSSLGGGPLYLDYAFLEKDESMCLDEFEIMFMQSASSDMSPNTAVFVLAAYICTMWFQRA